MKSHIIFFIHFILICNIGISQKINWTSTDPFQSGVFIENRGQFDKWVKSTEPVSYVLNNRDKIFFTRRGLVYKLEKVVKIPEKERELQADGKKKPNVIVETYCVNLEWLQCNENPILRVSDEVEPYYTFGEKGYEKLKFRGYKKLLFQNLYPGIDVEYTIPEQGGIKYVVNIQPGADISKLKMKYSGDLKTISVDKDGNILITTDAGTITDHAPKSFYEKTKIEIPSFFELEKNVVQIGLEKSYDREQTILVDPWTTLPTGLASDNAAYDIETDFNGNVYVSGGTVPFKLSKYSNTGTLLWTFTNPFDWAYGKHYSKFTIIQVSGTALISEGYVIDDGPKVMKIDSSGNLQITSAKLIGSQEIWTMYFNNCSGQLLGFGGGTKNVKNLHLIADTNLSGSTVKNFNNFLIGASNDISSVIMDNNGDFFALMSSEIGLPSVNNKLQKSLFSSNYDSPTAFSVNSGYDFLEVTNQGIPGFIDQQTARSNALAVNSSYLFSYDGMTLKAWNKNNGNALASFLVDGSYAGGQNRKHEGIDVDECNNIFVGGANKVHVFSFSGSSFSEDTVYTTEIPNEVYDLHLGSGKLYVCGLGFVSEIQISSPCNALQLTISAVNSCDSTGTATVNVTGGTPPYSYLWNISDSTQINNQTITGLTAGTYHVTVSDSPCGNKFIKSDSVIITEANIVTENARNICQGDSISAGGDWQKTSGIYFDTISASGFCDSIVKTTLTVKPLPIINTGNDTTIQQGVSIQLSASGGTQYSWSPSSGLSCSNCPNPVASPESTTLYIVSVTDSGGCTDTDSIRVTVESVEPPCYIDENIVPNIFSPNGDGKNDVLKLQGQNITLTVFRIFDRWGELLFETSDPGLVWDGSFKGKPLNPAVFVYYLEAECPGKERVILEGNITMVR